MRTATPARKHNHSNTKKYQVYKVVAPSIGYTFNNRIFAYSKEKAIQTFCKLHGLNPDQAIILFSYSLLTIERGLQ